MKNKPRIKAEIQKEYVEFCRFLKQNNAYDEYFKQLKEQQINRPIHFILSAFRWDDSAKGRLYWGRLHDKWVKICAENQL